jgi:hypothetical protein
MPSPRCGNGPPFPRPGRPSPGPAGGGVHDPGSKVHASRRPAPHLPPVALLPRCADRDHGPPTHILPEPLLPRHFGLHGGRQPRTVDVHSFSAREIRDLYLACETPFERILFTTLTAAATPLRRPRSRRGCASGASAASVVPPTASSAGSCTAPKRVARPCPTNGWCTPPPPDPRCYQGASRAPAVLAGCHIDDGTLPVSRTPRPDAARVVDARAPYVRCGGASRRRPGTPCPSAHHATHGGVDALTPQPDPLRAPCVGESHRIRGARGVSPPRLSGFVGHRNAQVTQDRAIERSTHKKKWTPDGPGATCMWR